MAPRHWFEYGGRTSVRPSDLLKNPERSTAHAKLVGYPTGRFSRLGTLRIVIARNPQMHLASFAVYDPDSVRSRLIDRCK